MLKALCYLLGGGFQKNKAIKFSSKQAEVYRSGELKKPKHKLFGSFMLLQRAMRLVNVQLQMSFQAEFETMTKQHGETCCILSVLHLLCRVVGILKSSAFNSFQKHHIYIQ